ncbi:MAG: AI-2E family transporter, partial [Verrucomicrobia bacterium]|nr:AI-2E family transporter [Verrucomicrobiota bacterium]
AGVVGAAIGMAVGVWFVVRIGWPMVPVMLLGAVAVLTYTDVLARVGVGEVFAGLGLGALPVVGTALVWLPAAIWLFHQGSTGWGIFMLIWGIGVGNLDNIVKPWLISQGSDMPFILIFFGVLGGALAFGFIGVFIGPTLLAVGFRLVEEWSAKARSSTRRSPAAALGRKCLLLAGGLLLLYLLAAYIIAPLDWRADTRHHPDLSSSPTITHTASGIPGDPLNIGLMGSEEDVIRGMTAAAWYPADPITFRSSVRIAVDSVFRRPDDDAPVSDLYLFGRKQNLAFELPVGDSPRQRHHVRFWRSDRLDEGRPIWFGSATFDERVGLSHTTGEVTHHIGPNVDAERDRIVQELKKAGQLQEVYWVDHFHRQLEGRNGGGDIWRTDGRLAIAVLLVHPHPPTPATNQVGNP